MIDHQMLDADWTLESVLRRNADDAPHGVFLEDQGETLTWLQVYESARAIAANLRRIGVEPGDRVGICLPNQREFILAWFGIGVLGAIEVPLDPKLTQSAMSRSLAHSEAVALIYASDADDRAAAAYRDLPGLRLLIRVADSGVPCSTTPAPLSFRELLRPTEDQTFDVSRSAPVAIMYTSGTTGEPKGVVLSHAQHVTNGVQAAKVLDFSDADRILVCLPLHHNMAQGYGIWPALVSRATVVLKPRFSASAFWQQVRESRATVFPFVGDIVAILTKTTPDSREHANNLRVAFGQPVPANLHRKFEVALGTRVVHLYGSTEATIPVWAFTPSSPPGSAGTVIEGFDVEIRDDAEQAVAPGVIGEICVNARAPYALFSGYYKDDVGTAQALRDGWFHTRDLGSFDPVGNLWFHGRLGDSIRHRGQFINVSEIEQAALDHRAVRMAAVFGVRSDLVDDDIMIAVTTQTPGVLTHKELWDWLTLRLPRDHVPTYVDILDVFPLTRTGKVRKVELRQRGVASTTVRFDVGRKPPA